MVKSHGCMDGSTGRLRNLQQGSWKRKSNLEVKLLFPYLLLHGHIHHDKRRKPAPRNGREGEGPQH